MRFGERLPVEWLTERFDRRRSVGQLLAAFSAVAVAAEHLAVVRRSVTALRPRCNVVGFHLLNIKMLATNRADTFLLFILATFGVTIESTDLQVPFVCVEHIPINALLITDI